MQFVNLTIGDRLVIVDISKDVRGGITLYEACWSEDPKVLAIAPTALEAVSKVKDRIMTMLNVPQKPARILLVEDDEGAAEVAKMICELDGHEVLLAKNGVEAMVKLGTNQIDLVLTDLNMPALDGVTLAKRVKDIPVVAVTAAGPATLKKLEGLGIAAQVTKPYTPETLRQAVRQALVMH
ncbi:MAG: histidine kinase [Cyanobacteria bacterium RYN_339]|nr:histidine kinase [Cyanobacteria bacterium RYN_339]